MADPYDMNDRKSRGRFPYSQFAASSASGSDPAPAAPTVDDRDARAQARGFKGFEHDWGPAAEPVGTAPPVMGYNNNLVAGQFRMPSVPDFANGEGYPSFNAAAYDKHDRYLPDGQKTAAPAGPVMAKRRSAAQVDGGPGAQQVYAGHVSEDIGGPAERERQQRIGDIDTALLRLGPLNMRSKREMFTQLTGAKDDLTKARYGAANERGQLNARLDTDANQTSANLAEAAARRRNEASMFNADLGEKVYQYDTGREDAAAALAAKAPLNALEFAKGLQELKANDAKATRDQAEFDATIGSKANAEDRAAVMSYIKDGGMSLEQAQQRVLQDRMANGENARGSRDSSTAYGAQLDAQRKGFNDSGWFENLAGLHPYVPLNKPQVDNIQDLTQVDVQKLPLYSALRVFTGKNNEATVTGEDGRPVHRYLTDDEADALKQQQGLMRRSGY